MAPFLFSEGLAFRFLIAARLLRVFCSLLLLLCWCHYHFGKSSCGCQTLIVLKYYSKRSFSLQTMLQLKRDLNSMILSFLYFHRLIFYYWRLFSPTMRLKTDHSSACLAILKLSFKVVQCKDDFYCRVAQYRYAMLDLEIFKQL